MKEVTPELLRRHPLPSHEGGDKDSRGRVLVVGGGAAVPGAALLAAEAALRAGAGKLQMATCRSIAVAMGLMMPEALVFGCAETPDGGLSAAAAPALDAAAARADAVLVGPGMMEQPATGDLVQALLARLDPVGGPAVLLDAGALERLQEMPDCVRRHAGRVVLTPHSGEMAKLLGTGRDEVQADPLEAGRRAAAFLQAVVVMKGSQTRIVSPSGEALLFTGGTVGLATSGSGDTLAGMIAALLARGAPPLWAAAWGVYLHGEAGARLHRHLGGIGFLARELPGQVPAIMGALCGGPRIEAACDRPRITSACGGSPREEQP